MRILFFTIIFSSLLSCNPIDREAGLPKYWCWVSEKENTDWEEIFKGMADLGIGGALISAPEQSYAQIAVIAQSYNIQVHAWQIIMMADKASAIAHPEWLSVNRNGHSLADSMAYVPYYKFMSPILPEVKNHITEKIKRIAAIEGIKGISLDYTRYVDVILPGKLWAKYDIVQDKEYPQWDYGYHPMMIDSFKQKFGYSPLDIEDPTLDQQWKQFRYDLITDIANELSLITRQSGKFISASPFPTPSIARKLVRQDWDKWSLDLVFPMVYNGMYWDDGKEWMASCIQENIQTMTDKDCTVYTGIYVPGHRNSDFNLGAAMATVLENGSAGISLFDYGALTEEEKEVVKKFIATNP